MTIKIKNKMWSKEVTETWIEIKTDTVKVDFQRRVLEFDGDEYTFAGYCMDATVPVSRIMDTTKVWIDDREGDGGGDIVVYTKRDGAVRFYDTGFRN